MAASTNIDEIGRETDSAWDGRHRVVGRTFPEGDAEQFAYDSLDNVLSLTQLPKPSSGLANTTVSASYDPTWNHLASITDALSNTTNFLATVLSGAGVLAGEPASGNGGTAFVPTRRSLAYSAIGLVTQMAVDAAGTRPRTLTASAI